MPKTREAQLRHAKYYAVALKMADESYMRGGSATYEGLQLLDFDYDNIERAQAWAQAHLDDNSDAAALCVEFALGGRHILGVRQPTESLIQWLQACLQSASRLGDKLSAQDCHTGLGLAHCRLGDTRVGIEHHSEALAIARDIRDKKGEAIALANLGIAYENLGDYTRALEFHENALKLDREIGYRRGVEVKAQR